MKNLGLVIVSIGTLICFAVEARAFTSTHSYSPVEGTTLQYVVANPLGSGSGDKYPVWIFQPGDGMVIKDSGLITRYGLTTVLANALQVVFIWPQLRREIYASELKSYCELDFFHRINDLSVLIDEVKKLPHVDATKIVLVGESAGSEIVTKVANLRNDILAVSTIGGGISQLMDYLKEDGDDISWTGKAMNNVCAEGTYIHRSGQFWRQLLFSGLEQDIKNSKVPYLALVGSEDNICKPAIVDRHVDEVLRLKDNFEFVVVQGMGHGPGFRIGPWKLIQSFVNKALQKD
jgi:dienelactone hydrolase